VCYVSGTLLHFVIPLLAAARWQSQLDYINAWHQFEVKRLKLKTMESFNEIKKLIHRLDLSKWPRRRNFCSLASKSGATKYWQSSQALSCSILLLNLFCSILIRPLILTFSSWAFAIFRWAFCPGTLRANWQNSPRRKQFPSSKYSYKISKILG